MLAPIPLVALSTIIVIALAITSFTIGQSSFYLEKSIRIIALSIPSLILTCTIFLLIENFTYIAFNISSMSSSNEIVRYAYLCFLFIIFIYSICRVSQANSNDGIIHSYNFFIKRSTYALLLISFLTALLSYRPPFPIDMDVNNGQSRNELPNIIILSSDGINAENMSVYGNERKTTPFLESIVDETLIFHNHWTNSSPTTGSIGALLSGKYPASTKVIYRPDTFKAQDMYQHLPGILLKLGYYNIDLSIRHYADANDLKLRNSFHYANHRDLLTTAKPLYTYFLLRWPSAMQFIEESWQRIYGRLAHLSNQTPMGNPFKFLGHEYFPTEQSPDKSQINLLKQQILTAQRPLFAHVHLLGTHGPKFYYEEPVFTKTKEQAETWMEDHYDNAIYQWDAYIQEVYQMLEKVGQLNNTILIINSDHGKRWAANKTLPLIIRFPYGKYAKIHTQPSQRLDIAPTILNYLNIKKPQWMDGYDLLDRPNISYPIFIVGAKPGLKQNEAGAGVVSADLSPPFYTLGIISMAYCGNIYSININSNQKPIITEESVHVKTRHCHHDTLDKNTAYKMIIEHLRKHNFDVKHLKK